jgi:hypothetical protein
VTGSGGLFAMAGRFAIFAQRTLTTEDATQIYFKDRVNAELLAFLKT